MKRVKMIALGMAVIVGGLTACGSAKEATTCKTAYAENGQYYVYVDKNSLEQARYVLKEAGENVSL